MTEQELKAAIRENRRTHRTGSYPHALRDAIVAHSVALIAQGVSIRSAAARVGLQPTTVRHWLISASKLPAAAPRLVPVVRVASPTTMPNTVITAAVTPTRPVVTIRFPSGATIDGVDLLTLAQLLRTTP